MSSATRGQPSHRDRGIPRGGTRRVTVVLGSPERAVFAGSVFVRKLFVGGFDMTLVCPSLFLARCVRVDSASAAIKAHAVDVSLANHGAVYVRRVDHGGIYVHHGGVIGEDAVLPASAHESHAGVSESVVNPAIEAHMRAP